MSEAAEGLQRIFGLIAQGTQNTTTENQPQQGHKFMSQAFLDGRGGAFTQVYQCECGQVYVATCKGRKQPIHMTVIDTACPLPTPGAQR